jgi:tetratricopeptide (TPR) repeat protein
MICLLQLPIYSHKRDVVVAILFRRDEKMSSLIVPSKTVANNIPLGRRIMEIMKEKGGYYSITAMAKRLGLSRETYRLMLNGTRDIYIFELEKIARDLKVSSERILQQDVHELVDELLTRLRMRDRSDNTLVLAEKFVRLAIGISERGYALNLLGIAFFERKEFERAHEIWIDAYHLADEVRKSSGDTDLCYQVMRNLMLSYVEKKDFGNAIEMSDQVEKIFDGQPIVLSEMLYTRAKLKESMGDFIGAAQLADKCLENCQASMNKIMIGRALINSAHYQYLLRNYASARERLECADSYLENDVQTKIIAQKELMKVLIKLGQCEEAETRIRRLLDSDEIQPFSDVDGKLRVLLSRANQDIQHAEYVANEERYSKKVRYLACKLLINHYRVNGDAFMFMRYHLLAEECMPSSSDVLDEGDM